MATYKRLAPQGDQEGALEPEINFLNITAMMDMMTIILVFLLKSMAASSASIPQSDDLAMPKSVLTTEASQEGLRPSLILEDRDRRGYHAGLPGPHRRDPRHRGQSTSGPGPNDLYSVPWPPANALQAWRERGPPAAPGHRPRREQQRGHPHRRLQHAVPPPGRSALHLWARPSSPGFHLMVLQGPEEVGRLGFTGLGNLARHTASLPPYLGVKRTRRAEASAVADGQPLEIAGGLAS